MKQIDIIENIAGKLKISRSIHAFLGEKYRPQIVACL
jgi:hypothetical protein